jgi:uncharacterized membrane protein
MPGHPDWTHRLLSDDDLDAVARAVTAAETSTSAEIRVHLERRLPRGLLGKPADPLGRARELFARLGMHRTRDRNGVLIYLALEDRKLAIVGDDGIHARVGAEYWARLRDLMVERLQAGAAREGLVAAVAELGQALTEHFPRRPDDRNELTDAVSLE